MNDRTDEIPSTRAPTLGEDQIEVLGRYGHTRETEVGQVLFRAGDPYNDFIVVLEGEVEVVDDFTDEARTIGVFRAGRFLGELPMLTGQGLSLSAVVRQGGRVLAISRERLKEVVTEEPDLSDIILKAFLARRAWGMRTGLGLRIVGSRHSSDATRLREFAARNRGKNTTLLASMGASGMGPTLAVESATDREVFEAYVEEVLTQSLRSGQIVVMDNLTAHKGDRVRELIEERGCELLYLPPYSPDLKWDEKAEMAPHRLR